MDHTHQITRSRLSGVLLSLIGKKMHGASLDRSGVTFFERHPRHVAYTDISQPVVVKRRFGFSTISIVLMEGRKLEFSGARWHDAETFVDKLNTGWKRHFGEIVKNHIEELASVYEAVQRLSRPRRYPAACLVEPFLHRANALVGMLPQQIPREAITDETYRMIEAVRAFQEDPQAFRKTAIPKLLEAELTEAGELFDTIETHPLTQEQRLAVVTDEDATLVLAGAGSGKTSVIVAKAAYLIEKGIRKHSEILLLAFGRDAAAEMADRIHERVGSSVDAVTFHGLGYEIIRQVEGTAPALAPHATDEASLRNLLVDILIEDIAQRPDLSAILLEWFSEFYFPYRSEWEFETRDEYFQHVEANELRTLKGELVKSFEELEISNWLFLNGIDYEYEPDYEHDIPDNDRRTYTPDFRLTESGIYIEHFGVRKSRGPDGEIRLVTAPHVNRDKYLKEMEWKHKVHERFETTLIQTFSYEREEGRLKEALAEQLAPFVTINPPPTEEIFADLRELGLVDSFTQTLATFLKHFKSTGVSIEECRERAAALDNPKRELAFLKIFEAVYEHYDRRLGDRIDFEDMIIRAIEHVDDGRYQSPYRHFLVDEFQDVSVSRADLLLALKEQHQDARIFAVGDDWQAIYRFAGSDIHLMRNFGLEFGGTLGDVEGIHATVDLGRTFRSVDKIALPARSFVLENPSQITKEVVPAGITSDPAIKVTFYTRVSEDEVLRSVLSEIEKSSSPDDKISVLLLGRYRFVGPDNLANLTESFRKLSLQFMTVHSSKGLEADHVIVLHANSGRLGFPSEIVDDEVLDMVLPEPEKFDHAEERRLFYVAMTRARKSVTVLADRERPSVFAREVIDNPSYGAIVIGEAGVASHRCGECGGRMLSQTHKNGRQQFVCEHRFLCGEVRPPCGKCKSDLPVEDETELDTMVCSCGERYMKCPKCSDGWLVERKGQYGPFLGCVKFPSCKGTRKLPAAKV